MHRSIAKQLTNILIFWHAFIYSLTQQSFIEDLLCVEHHAFQGDTLNTISVAYNLAREVGKPTVCVARWKISTTEGRTVVIFEVFSSSDGRGTNKEPVANNSGRDSWVVLVAVYPAQIQRESAWGSRPAWGNLTDISITN